MDKIEKNTDGKKRWIAPKLLKLDQKETEGGPSPGFTESFSISGPDS